MEKIIGNVTFVVISNGGPPERSVENEMFHVRTLFDYNPDADDYNPCKELGLFFKKGEVLKIHRFEANNFVCSISLKKYTVVLVYNDKTAENYANFQRL